jgi:3-oxoacyl-[acyl-carrier-protein] synthase-3
LPKAKITALGCYTPPRVLTNFELEQMVQTSNQWILERTGISERHIAEPEVATSDMAACAAKLAIEQRGIDASELNCILVCTVTPDMLFPSTACLVQHKIGAHGAWGFDLIAACSGFLYGLATGAHLVGAGTHAKVLVIGADTMSRIIDYTDRSTCILFGGSRMPATVETVQQRMHYVHQDGQQVFRYAVRKMYEVCHELLQRNGLTADDVALMIPHQANRRIIAATAERLGLPFERIVINIDKYGNTTAGTIPLATRDALLSGRLKKGDLVLFAAVGAGYTVGAALWRWAY